MMLFMWSKPLLNSQILFQIDGDFPREKQSCVPPEIHIPLAKILKKKKN